MDLNVCRNALKQFSGKRVLVVGDLMLDEHIWGTVARISPEAPVMVVEVESNESDNRPGGAANVANNLLAFGAEVSVVGVVGDDESGRILADSLKTSGADVSGILIDRDRPTTRKARIWASRRHQVVRVDRESKKKLSSAVVKRVVQFVENAVQEADAVILSDYNKGLLTNETAQAAIVAAEKAGKVSASNPKPMNLYNFAGVGMMTLNQFEASAGAGVDIVEIADVENAGKKIMESTRCKGLVITRGAQGLSVFDSQGRISHLPALESEVYDVAGAGDTVISALTMSLACKLDPINSGFVANCAGGVVVRKVGVATTSVKELDGLLAGFK